MTAILMESQRLARAGQLFAPASFKSAPMSQLKDICNGCGAANAKFDFVPDRVYGTYIGYSCNIHDWMYNEGRSIEDKEEADRVFLNNLYRLIERDKHKWYKPTWLQRRRALKYYKAVKYFGGSAFWAGKDA